MAKITFIEMPRISRQPFDEYEYQTNIKNATVFFNDSALDYTHLVMLQAGNNRIRLSLQNASPVRTDILDTTVTYREAFTDTDIVYTTMIDKLKEDIIIKSQQAPHSLTFNLMEQDVYARFKEDGSFDYVDENEEVIWIVEAPFAYDAAGNEIDVAVSYNGSSYTYELLTDGSEVYPITLDPTITLSSNDSLDTVTSGQYQDVSKTTRLYLTPEEGMDSKIVSFTLNCTNSYSASYGEVEYYTFYDKNNEVIENVTWYVNNTRIEVPANAYFVVISFFARPYSLSSNYYKSTSTLYLTSVEVDTDKTLYFKKLNTAMKRSVSSRNVMTPTYLLAIPGSTNAENKVTKVYKAAPGSTFMSGSYAYTVQLYGNYSMTFSASLKYYDANGTLLSTITISKPTATTVQTRTITVPAGAVTMVFNATAKCNTVAGTSMNFDFTNITKTAGTVPGFVYHTFTPSASGTYKTYAMLLFYDVYGSLVGPYTPTVPNKVFYLNSNNNWVEEEEHEFIEGEPVEFIYMYGDANQSDTTLAGFYIISGQTTPTSEFILFGIYQNIIDGGSELLPLNESAIDIGSDVLSINESIATIDYSTLTIKDTIQGIDVSTLPLNVSIQASNNALLELLETIQGKAVDTLSILSNIHAADSLSLPLNESVILQTGDVLPVIETIKTIDVDSLSLTENIQESGFITLPIPESIIDSTGDILSLLENIQEASYESLYLIENTISGNASTVPLIESILAEGINTLPMSLNVLINAYNELTILEDIKITGSDSLYLLESISGSGYSTLRLKDNITVPAEQNILQVFDYVITGTGDDSIIINDRVILRDKGFLLVKDRVVIPSVNKNTQNSVNIIEKVMIPNIPIIETIITEPEQPIRLTPKHAVRMKGRRYS